MESAWSRVFRTLFDAHAWLTLIATPLSFAALACFIATNAWKIKAWLEVDPAIRGILDLPALVAQDLTFYMVVVGVLYLAQFSWIVVRLPLRLAGLWVIASASANLVSLVTTDEPLHLRSSEFGMRLVERVGETLVEFAMEHQVDAGLAVGILAVISLGARFLLNGESSDPDDPLNIPRRKGFAALPPFLWAIIAAATAMLTPIPESWEVARLANNRVLIKTILFRWNPLDFDELSDLSASVNFGSLVDLEKSDGTGNGRNVVIVVLESTGHRHSGLEKGSRTRMQTLSAMAKNGAWTNRAYTPIPNTTKALYGIQCGRMPLWQTEHREITEENKVACLANALSDIGYATAFFQSALGRFEDRPRFVAKMGFQHFEAWENIQGEPAGYRGSDDLSLAGAFESWLAEQPKDRPFFATLLTSSPQDPYALSPSLAKRLRKRGYPIRNASSQKRFALLVQETDTLLASILDTLKNRGVAENTVVVVVGNHGEGFGDNEANLHDNNYFEESIRVPFVVSAPGVAPGEIEGSVSLLDVGPTVVGLLGLVSALDDTPLTGRDVFSADLSNRPLVFSCHFEGRCYGSVLGLEKVVFLPEKNKYAAFDLERDPDERQPISINSSDPRFGEVRDLISGYRIKREKRTLAPVTFETGWRCEQNASCKHPETPDGGVFK
jgi:arylsulfatase A-like enzyme